MSEELQADPAHVERGAGRVDGERDQVAVVKVFPNGIQQRVAHRRHELGEHNSVSGQGIGVAFDRGRGCGVRSGSFAPGPQDNVLQGLDMLRKIFCCISRGMLSLFISVKVQDGTLEMKRPSAGESR